MPRNPFGGRCNCRPCGGGCTNCSFVIVLIFSDPKIGADDEYVLAFSESDFCILHDMLGDGCSARVYVLGDTYTNCDSVVADLESTYTAACVSLNPGCESPFLPGDIYPPYLPIASNYGCFSREHIGNLMFAITPDGHAMTGVSYKIYRTCGSTSCTLVTEGDFDDKADGVTATMYYRNACCCCPPPCPEIEPPDQVRITFVNVSGFENYDASGTPFDGYSFVRDVQYGPDGTKLWEWGDHAYSSGPTSLDFQDTTDDCSGSPVDGTYCRTFRLYLFFAGESVSSFIYRCCLASCPNDDYLPFWYYGAHNDTDNAKVQNSHDVQYHAPGDPYRDCGFVQPWLNIFSVPVCTPVFGGGTWLSALTGFSCDPFMVELTLTYSIGPSDGGGAGGGSCGDGPYPMTFTFKIVVTEEP